MSFLIAAEVLAAATMGAGACGYFLGDLRGARRRFAAQDVASEEFENIFAFHVPAKMQGEKRALPDQAKSDAAVASGPMVRARPINGAVDPERLQTFADMPPIEELRAQVAAIRAQDNVWAQRESVQRASQILGVPKDQPNALIDRYRHAIDELRRANAAQRGLFVPMKDAEEYSGSTEISTPDQGDLQVTFQPSMQTDNSI